MVGIKQRYSGTLKCKYVAKKKKCYICGNPTPELEVILNFAPRNKRKKEWDSKVICHQCIRAKNIYIFCLETDPKTGEATGRYCELKKKAFSRIFKRPCPPDGMVFFDQGLFNEIFHKMEIKERKK